MYHILYSILQYSLFISIPNFQAKLQLPSCFIMFRHVPSSFIMFHVFAMCCQEIPCFFGYLEAIDGNVTRLFHEAEHGINKPSPQSPEIDGKKKHIPTLLAYDCFAHITPKPNV